MSPIAPDETGGPQSGRQDIRLWAWSARAAVIAAPVALLVLLIGVAVLRAATEWPSDDYQGWALLAIVILALVPIILALVDTAVSQRGEIRVWGVSLSFASASQEAAAGVRTATLEENLGITTEEAVGRTSLPVVLRTLRRAHDTDVTVVDLRAGRTWWESRLLVLVAGAAHSGRPLALAFVGERSGTSRAFIGWAEPARLLDLHLKAEPDLASAYAAAVVQTRQWDLGTRGPGPDDVVLPWGDALSLPANPDEASDPQFALELFLNSQIEALAPDVYQRHVTIRRLLELYEPALVTDHVETGSDDAVWIDLLRRSHRPFYATTSGGAFKGLVPRDALFTALVLRLAESAAQGHGDSPSAP
jgi:hypothetical protein